MFLDGRFSFMFFSWTHYLCDIANKGRRQETGKEARRRSDDGRQKDASRDLHSKHVDDAHKLDER